jgi:hypothetical protein
MFHLKGKAHHKMETARSNFFWHGPGQKKKYLMMKWKVLASPKGGGLAGFTNTRIMNQCLLCKWICKLERGDNNPCCKLLRAKYLGEKGFYCKSCFLPLFTTYIRPLTRFWIDVWLGNCPFSIVYSRIFDICDEQEESVYSVLKSNELTFRRSFGEVE